MTRERARKQRRAKILRRVAQPIHRLRGSLRQTFYGVAGQQRVIDAVIQAIAHEIVFATDIRRNQPRVMFNRGELASAAQEEGRRVLRARLRSEERRVGKECRSRGSRYAENESKR